MARAPVLYYFIAEGVWRDSGYSSRAGDRASALHG
jgi:hypothetical protein